MNERMKTIILIACAMFALNGTADLMFMVRSSSVFGFTDTGLLYAFALGKATLIEGVIIFLALRMGKDMPTAAWLFNVGAGGGLLALSFLAQRIDSAMVRDAYDTMDGFSKFIFDWIIGGVPVILLAVMFFSDAFSNRDADTPEVKPPEKKRGNDFAKSLLSGILPTAPELKELPKASPPRQKQAVEADTQPK